MWGDIILKVDWENLEEVVESRRLGAVRRMSVEDDLPRKQLETLLNGIISVGAGLKALYILGTKSRYLLSLKEEEEEVGMAKTELSDGAGTEKGEPSLSSIEPELVVRAINRMEEVQIDDSQLTWLQIEPILRDISQTVSRVKMLDVSKTNISKLDPTLLASAVTRMIWVVLNGTDLTFEQAKMMMTALNVEGSELMKLDISENNLSQVDPFLLAQAVNSLEEVDMDSTELTVEQVKAIFNAKLEDGSRLKKLGISANEMSFSSQDPFLMARAVHKMEEVEMRFNDLTPWQLDTILSRSMRKNTILMKLDITENNLMPLYPYSLAAAMRQFEEVSICCTKLTFKQARLIMLAISANDSRVKTLEISGNNLSKIKPHELAKAVNKLEEIDIKDSKLTLQQVEAILTQSLVQTSLKTLWMTQPEGVLDYNLLAKARMVIKDIELDQGGSKDSEDSEDAEDPEDPEELDYSDSEDEEEMRRYIEMYEYFPVAHEI